MLEKGRHWVSSLRANNRNITIHGVTHYVTKWAEIAGISPSTIYARLRRGWIVERAVFEKAKPHVNRRKA
jgi:hypothetical protein